MNIFWTVNSLMPEVAKEIGISSTHSISWVDAMSKKLQENNNIKLCIATKGHVDSIISKHINGILYFVLPADCNEYDYWKDIFDTFSPDIIHIYGTENDQNRKLVELYKEKYPIIVSLQGIISEYCRHYYAGISFSEMVRYTSLLDIIKPTGFFSGKRRMKSLSNNEKWILQNVRNVEGRSTWDRVSALNINPSLNYYFCSRMIRSAFFEKKWNINNIERYSLFIHQANYPIKGFHFVLEALSKLKVIYPNIKLYVAGSNYLNPTSRIKRMLPSGYVKYIKHLIKQHNLNETVQFTGYLTSEELSTFLTKMHVVIIPSAIENAPNSLAESEIIGVPTIASYVGGNMDMLRHNTDGFLYCYNEPNMLAEYIREIFDNDELAESFSISSRAVSRDRHNPDKLVSTLLSIYKDCILNERSSI